MGRKINNVLTIIMGSSVGVWLGHGIYVYWDYRTRPGLYAMQSAPWYTGIIVYGAVMLVTLAVCAAIKIVIRKKYKKADVRQQK